MRTDDFPTSRFPWIARVLPILVVLLARRPALALDYDVDREDDVIVATCSAAPNDCSLRGAVIASNLHAGDDVINLPAGTYTLSIAGTGEDSSATGDLDVRDDLVISGAGQVDTIIDGGAIDRVIQSDPTGGGGIEVTIRDVTIQHGASPALASKNAEGGGVRNGGTPLGAVQPAGILHLNFVTVDDNSSEKHGGGISNEGTLTMVNCLVSNNESGFLTGGGGIVQDDLGSLSLSGVTVRGNNADAGGTAAGSGGGLFIGFFSSTAGPMVSIESSQVSGNTARTAGGIHRIRGTVSMRNTTISGNAATQVGGFGGGGIGDSGFTNGLQPTMALVNCTVTNNTAGATDGGGGIDASGAGIRLGNTIVASNTGNGTPSDLIGTLISKGHNLVGKATGFTVDQASDTTGDIMGVAVANLHLDPTLTHVGGPPTELHVLLPGSPAIDAGGPIGSLADFGCPNTDQRASTRPIDGDGDGTETCDIGAYEVFEVPTTPTPTPGPGGTPTATPTPAQPTVTATPNPGAEICDNCIDDDGDQLADRDDPGCDQPFDGGAQGLGDPARAKRLLKCAGAIQKGGSKLAGKQLGRFQKCLAAAFACVELKNADAGCIAKATKGCDKAFAALPGDETRLATTLAKACGPAAVDPNDLVSASGLGYGGHTYRCETLLGEPAPVDAATLAACVAGEHACRVGATLGVQVPRAAELLGLVGRQASELPCLPAGAGAGAGLGDATRAKRAVKCEQAITKAGAKLVNGELKLVPKCANAVLACLQLPNAKCATKSRATCTKTQGKVDALAGKLAAAVAKACEASGLAFADVLDTSGLGLVNLDTACAGIDVPALTGVVEATTCLTRYQQCRARQLLENQLPRLRELLGIGQLTLP